VILILFLGLAAVAIAAAAAWIVWASGSTLGPKRYAQGLHLLTDPSPSQSQSQTSPDGPWRLVTLNAGYAYGAANNTPERVPRETIVSNLDRLGRALSALNADFIVLQEVDFDSARTHRVNQLDWLRRHTSHAHAALAYNWDVRYLPWPYWPPRAHFGRILSGQALLSRFPIRAHRKVTLPKPSVQSGWYNRFFIDRAIHLCTVDLAGKVLQLAGCHLESFHPEWRSMQARLLTDAIGAVPPGPLIVAGDLNAYPAWATPRDLLNEGHTNGAAKDDTLAHLEASGLHGLFNETLWAAREPDSYTFASYNPMACIDHAFCNDSIEILDGGVCRESGDASDHFPVWMDFRLRAPA